VSSFPKPATVGDASTLGRKDGWVRKVQCQELWEKGEKKRSEVRLTGQRAINGEGYKQNQEIKTLDQVLIRVVINNPQNQRRENKPKARMGKKRKKIVRLGMVTNRLERKNKRINGTSLNPLTMVKTQTKTCVCPPTRKKKRWKGGGGEKIPLRTSQGQGTSTRSLSTL